MINEKILNLEGKVTITIKIDVAEDTDNIKDGNSVKSTALFVSIEGLHERAEELALKLLNKLSKKFPAKYSQTRLGDKADDK